MLGFLLLDSESEFPNILDTHYIIEEILETNGFLIKQEVNFLCLIVCAYVLANTEDYHMF